jgi:hypothetical protein
VFRSPASAPPQAALRTGLSATRRCRLKALIYADLAFLRDGKRFEKSLEHNLAPARQFVKRYVRTTASWPSARRTCRSRCCAICSMCRAALGSAERRAPAELIAAIDRMAPMLRFFRHGDGGLALFNGSLGGRAQPDRPGAGALRLERGGAGHGAGSGFQRLAAGTSLVIADAGSPPGRGMDGTRMPARSPSR